MTVSMILAIGRAGELGNKGWMPWKLSEDLKNFKKITQGHHIILGRKTFESFGKPLPNRIHLIITRNPHYHADGALIFTNIKSAIEFAQSRGESECFICGGAEIYRLALGFVDRVYLTEVDYTGRVDTYLDDLSFKSWRQTHLTKYPANNGQPAWTFKILERS